MATSVDAARLEIAAKLAELEPQHEGLRDFARLDLQQQTLQEIQFSISQYDRRVQLLNTAATALEALVGDGHPVLDVREIMDAAFADLQAQQVTITAALAQFASNAAVDITLAGSDVEPK